MENQEISCCPRCKRPIEAKDHMNPAILAILSSVLPTVQCNCGYRGLPIKMKIEEYREWIKEKKPQ